MLDTQSNDLNLTHHARIRMNARRISPEAVSMVLQYGREVRTRGVLVYVIGRREITEARKEDLDLSALEGIQVLCSEDGDIITTYRNRDLSSLRTSSHPRRRSYRH